MKTISMSSTPSARSEPAGRELPDWFWNYLGADGPWQGNRSIGSQAFTIRGGIPRSDVLLTRPGADRGDFRSSGRSGHLRFRRFASLARMREWLVERYGDAAKADRLPITEPARR